MQCLRTWYVPGTVLGTGIQPSAKLIKTPSLTELVFQLGSGEKKQMVNKGKQTGWVVLSLGRETSQGQVQGRDVALGLWVTMRPYQKGLESRVRERRAVRRTLSPLC